MPRKILLILLIIATVLWTSFIYSNSLKSAEQSTEQSSGVTEVVNKVASAVGVKEEIPHKTVRKMAHFTEFAILAALLCADAFTALHAFISKKLYRVAFVLGGSVLACFCLAGIDELLQKTSGGRACQFSDVLIDTLGALCGAAICICAFLLFVFIRKKYLASHPKNEKN